MSKVFGYDATLQAAISKITAPKLARMSDVVAPSAAYLKSSGGNTLTLLGGILIAVGDSLFETQEITLGSSHFDSTVSAFAVGTDYCVYICDPTNGDDTDYSSEVYRISKNTTYPNGFTAANSRKIGGFHYGIRRKVNDQGVPINTSGTAEGSGWQTNVEASILPNSVWTLHRRPTCDPTGMVRLPSGLWSDIYLASDNGNNGFQSAYGATPMTGSEGLNWYIANEKAMRVGKRLPDYAEFCQIAAGSPEGQDGNNTYAWSKTSNTGRTTTGNVQYAVSANNVRDCVGNVWKWLNELCLDPTAASWGWQDVLGSGYGDIYMPSNTALHAVVGGGGWYNGVRGGSRAAGCDDYPWHVIGSLGALCVCDEL